MKMKLYVPLAKVHEFVVAIFGAHACYAEHGGPNPFTLRLVADCDGGKQITITKAADGASLLATVPVILTALKESAILTFTYAAHEEGATTKFSAVKEQQRLQLYLDQ